jgi:hypothetical protein
MLSSQCRRTDAMATVFTEFLHRFLPMPADFLQMDSGVIRAEILRPNHPQDTGCKPFR